MGEGRRNEEGRGEIWGEFQEERRGCCIMQIMIFSPPL